MGVFRESAGEGAVLARVEALDRACVASARGQGRRRLRVGQLADVFLTMSGHHELGFSSVRAYSYERVGRSGEWLYESRRVAKQLDALPAVRAAALRSALSWKMAALIGKHATSDTEHAILAAARRTTLREMEEILAECEAARDDADEERLVTVTRQVDVDTWWECQVTAQLVDHLEGRRVGSRWIEPVVAEATSTMQNAGIDPLVEAEAERCARLLSRDREAEAARARMEEAAERAADARGAPLWAVPDGADDAPGDGSPIPRDGRALDAMMRGLVHEMSRADLTLGAHIAELQALRGWAVLGFASFEQWGRERLGLERSALWQKVRLAKQVERLPEVGDAVRRGALSQTGAGIIARVADHRTVGAWLERGVRRTWMDLREEVEVAERWAGMRGLDRLTGVMPPNDAELEAYFAEQREVLSGGRLREELAKDEGVQMCKQRRGRGTREVRFRVPEDVFIELRMMEVAFGQAGFDVFLSFLCRQFWSVWLPLLGTSDKWEHIYRRDRYRCLCPTCDRRDLTLHHFIYRSRGGGDKGWNLGGVCFWCHLEGEHGGRLKVWGPAWRMRWEIGRRGEPPVMVVVGREVVAR